jgi:hypothetical protein
LIAIARTPPTLAPRHREALSPRAQALAGRLAAMPWARDFHLAGAAALALHLGHRPVADLELASAVNRLGAAERGRVLEVLLAVDPATGVETARDGLLAVRTGGGVPLRLRHCPYPLVGPDGEIDGLAVASLADLGLTMLDAIAGGGGSRRDLVELHLLCRELPLAELLDRAGERFGQAAGEFRRQALLALDRLAPPAPGPARAAAAVGAAGPAGPGATADLAAGRSETADRPATAAPSLPRLAVEVAWQEVEAWVDREVRTAGRRSWPRTC